MPRTFFALPVSRPALRAGAVRPLRPARIWAWAGAGAVLGGLLATLLFAPARWLAAATARATQGRVLLQETQGTLWQGSARLVLAAGQDGRGAPALPSRVEWRLRPRLTGAQLELQSDCCTTTPLLMQVQAGVSETHVSLADNTVQLPSALLTGLGTPWNTLQLQGVLQAQTHGLSLWLGLDRVNFQGRVEARLQQASTRLSTLNPVGSYLVELSGNDASNSSANTASLTLSSQPGSSLLLQGKGFLTGGRWHFSGDARADPAAASALDNLLNIIGRREGERSVITMG
ncbi:MAG: type II secretion system protein N [Brachymonas sp.]|nr:type II secretion system protein N [Brachymonas sp.]